MRWHGYQQQSPGTLSFHSMLRVLRLQNWTSQQFSGDFKDRVCQLQTIISWFFRSNHLKALGWVQTLCAATCGRETCGSFWRQLGGRWRGFAPCGTTTYTSKGYYPVAAGADWVKVHFRSMYFSMLLFTHKQMEGYLKGPSFDLWLLWSKG